MTTTAIKEALGAWHSKAEEAETHYAAHMARTNMNADEGKSGVEKFQELTKEANEAFDNYDKLVKMEKQAEENRKRMEEMQAPVRNHAQPQNISQGIKSIGELVTDSSQYKAIKGISRPRMDLDLDKFDMKSYVGAEYKTTMTTSAGFAPANNRTNMVVPFATEMPVVSDLIPQTTTTDTLIKWMESTTFTNNAAAVAEDGLKPEAALAYTERSREVRKIGVWLPVTEEQLNDIAQMQSIIEEDLKLMLRQEEADQLLNGSGIAPNLTGFYTAVTQTQAKGADSTPSAIRKAMTKIMWTGFANPSGVVLHPNDWEAIVLLQDANGNFIFGSPSAPVITPRIWGLPVVETTYAVENTGLVGDFRQYSQIFRRMGITLKITDSHADYFIYNRLAILVEERLALVIKRAAAFCEVTGI